MRTHTPVVFTELSFHGLTGYGEASMPPYLGESHESVIRFLNKAKALLAGIKEPFDISVILQQVDQLEEKNTSAKASVDIALHDLVGKILGKPWYELWNIDKDKAPFTTYTIGIGGEEMLEQKLEEGKDFRILKLKMGGENDRTMLYALRKLSNKPVAVDVNQGWKDKQHALNMIIMMKDLDVLFVEQPLPKEMKEEQRWLYERSPLPLIADESVQRFGDIEKAKGYFNGINIKLMKCTGMLEAYRMIAEARRVEMKVLIGCMSESSCAVSAAAQLTPLADWADLDGPLLIKQDHFDGVKFISGKITLPDAPGIGAVPKGEFPNEK